MTKTTHQLVCGSCSESERLVVVPSVVAEGAFPAPKPHSLVTGFETEKALATCVQLLQRMPLSGRLGGAIGEEGQEEVVASDLPAETQAMWDSELLTPCQTEAPSQ